jgi:hypothetical protein
VSAPLRVERIDHRHGERMLAIDLACPIQADFTLLFDRSPSFFAWPDAVFDRFDYVGGFRDDTLVAYGMIGFVAGYTGGAGRDFCYAGDLRALPEARGEGFGVRCVEAACGFVPPEIRLGFALVKKGNREGARVVRAAGNAAVSFEPYTSFEAHALLLLRRAGPPARYRVRRAGPGDLPALAALMQRAYDGRPFAPVVTPGELAADIARLPGFDVDRYYLAFAEGELVGALGAWDMNPVRRTVVLRYPPRGRLLHLAYDAARLVLRAAPPLPPPGGALRALTTTRVAVPSDDPAVLRALLIAVHDENVGRYHLLYVGFAGDDPLRDATRGWLSQRLASDVHAIRVEGTALPAGRPYLDLRFI